MHKTKATYMDADPLIPYANNPRLSDNAVDAVAASHRRNNFEFDLPLPNGRSCKRNGDVKRALDLE